MYKKAGWNSITEGLEALKTEFEQVDTKTTNVNHLWRKFKSTASDLMSKHIPSKLAKSKCNVPLLTPAIKKMIRKRDKLYKLWKSSRLQRHLAHFKQFKKALQKSMRHAYWDYINNLISPIHIQGTDKF